MGAPDQAERVAVGFARVLRAAGVAVPVGAVVDLTCALGAVGLGRSSTAYWAARATLVRRPEDVAAFDRSWATYWLGAEPQGAPVPPPPPEPVAADDGPDGDDRHRDGERPSAVVRYSATEVLRTKDLAELSPAEWEEARRLLDALRATAELRRTRRPARLAGRRGRPDLRATLRSAVRTDGELRPARRPPASRPRRLVLLADVSGSMQPYARAALRFAQAAVVARGPGRVEAFAVGTRLTRLTRQLGGRDPDLALRRAATAVVDYSGGTRLGAGLRAFNDGWGVRGAARGAVVVIVSDGWDRGDPDELGAQMARLSRVAHRIVWVNPLKASPGYQPLARGMAAALPHVDHFVEGHSLAALEDLAQLIGAGRP